MDNLPTRRNTGPPCIHHAKPLLEEPYRVSPMPELMARKRAIYRILGRAPRDAADALNRRCAQVELDAINRELARRAF